MHAWGWCVAFSALHALFIAAAWAADEPRLLGVRVVKATLGITNKTPNISFPGAEDKCRLGGYRGENRQEFYFDVEVDQALKTPPTLRFECGDVEVRCVWVGHTKVDSQRADGGVTFPLVFDGANPYALHMEVRDVPDVLLYGMHKPRERASGPFRDVPWPEGAVAAEWNLLFACLEVFRDMNTGDKGVFAHRPAGPAGLNAGPASSFADRPGKPASLKAGCPACPSAKEVGLPMGKNIATKDFDGYVAIGGFETTYPRIGRGPKGHSEGTPHIHLFLVVPPGWRIREASHLYIDAEGRFTGKIHCGPSACEGPSKNYDQGMVCAQKDFSDHTAFEFKIEADGSLMIRRREGAVEYHLRPDPATRSFRSGCEVFKADRPLCKVVVQDNCEAGDMRIQRTFYRNGPPEPHEEIIRYDPDTSVILSRTKK